MRDGQALRAVDHDARPGLLDRCQICGSSNLRQIIDLGHQPPCDSLLTAEQLNESETTYPLRLNQCEECSLAQLDYVVPAGKVYPADYPYKAGISWPVVAAHKAMAADLVARFGTGLVVDVGCNDGTLLKQFQALGCRVVGVEPTNIAGAADSCIAVWREFFGEQLARSMTGEISRSGDVMPCDGETPSAVGQAHIMTFTNVFAHMGDLGEVMRGIVTLLAKDGVLVIENHYLLDILDRNQFDTIYHEHVRTYTLKSLVRLFEQYGMEVFDVDRVPRYGGNIRVYVGFTGSRPVEASVGELLRLEEASGLGKAEPWRLFRDRVYTERYRFAEFCHEHAGSIAGCSAPGRASTLLNYYGVTPYMLPWTGELPNSLKLGKFVPGCHVPIVSNERIRQEQPEYLVLLAWHYAKEIIERLRGEGVRSTFVMPLPTLELVR